MNRINGKIKKFWGVSEIGFSFMATMETSFFIIFLTDVAKLPLALVAIITGFSGIADAVSAIVAGAVIDKFNLKGGKYRPWLLYCSPIVVIFFILMFTRIGTDVTAMILCSVGYIVSHFAWNIAWTANRAMIGVLTDDASERAFLSGRIGAGSSGGKVIASWLVPTLTSVLIAMFIGLGPIWGYTITAAVASLTFVVTYFVHFIITKGYDNPVAMQSTSAAKPKQVTLMDMLKTIVVNPQLLILIVGDALRLIGYYMVAATAAYYAKVVLGEPAAVSVILILFNLGTFVGSMLSGKAAKLMGTKKITLIGTGLAAVIFLLIFVLPVNKYLVYALLIAAEIIFGVAYGLTSSLYSMCGTQSEYKTGKDVKGTIMACSSLAIKIAIALRGVVVSATLAAISYTPDVAITAAAQAGIKGVFLLVPAVFTVLSFIVLLFFKIKDDEIAKMEQEIVKRRMKNV